MKISEVRIKLAKDEHDPRVKGYANITFEGLFVVHGIRILENEERVFIAMPSKKLPEGEYKDIAHPISAFFRTYITETVISEYQKTLRGNIAA